MRRVADRLRGQRLDLVVDLMQHHTDTGAVFGSIANTPRSAKEGIEGEGHSARPVGRRTTRRAQRHGEGQRTRVNSTVTPNALAAVPE
jgi:hypothetical protein